MRGIKSLPKEAFYSEMGSPVGRLTIITSKSGLHGIFWENDQPKIQKVLANLTVSEKEPVMLAVRSQLQEYFAGKRKKFYLPLVMEGTVFQNQTWYQLTQIPYGETISYGEQARRMGDQKRARAVGMCNGLNPISIVVPCHRVVGASGKLTGFAGGLDKKEYLLKLESLSKY